MAKVAIGVYLQTGPERLAATLASLRAEYRPGLELLLLPDGPDAALRETLEELRGVPQWATARPRGAPACFNRLVAASAADVLIFLEGGCEVGPRWLDHLLRALGADPRNGLAGPSTNRCWNEQGAFPGHRGGRGEVTRTAAEAGRRFGAELQTLEPLHSLADFCFAVRRDVVEAVGAADEQYRAGPCWEMDYNIRAARAGFRGVWAKAAYVYRPPFTARRQRQENRAFQASRERYQDKFCALRLLGGSDGYEPGCRGEACEHFAPRERIQVFLPLPRHARPPRSPRAKSSSQPLVSCILPTRNRADFVLQSVKYFERQDYSERELIVVDDGDDDLSSRLPASSRIRYLRLEGWHSIGAKRNLACREAHGEIIAQWDDDDWFAPGRLSAQVTPLLTGWADVTALVTDVFFELPTWTFWRCTPAWHRRMFYQDVHGSTLVYRRKVLQGATYPDHSRGEDAVFLHRALRQGARLLQLKKPGLFIYLRHGANTWSFRCGTHLGRRGWRQIDEPEWSPEERAFYATLSSLSG